MRSNPRVNCNLLTLLKYYKDFDHEVGGIVFGDKECTPLICRTVSIKHGSKNEISFLSSDLQLFCVPDNQSMIGTWHLHPIRAGDSPSITDLSQWSIWNSDYIHIVLAKTGYSIYNSFGERLVKYTFNKDGMK